MKRLTEWPYENCTGYRLMCNVGEGQCLLYVDHSRKSCKLSAQLGVYIVELLLGYNELAKQHLHKILLIIWNGRKID